MLRNVLVGLAAVVVLLVLGLWVIPVVSRSWNMRWGATDAEVAAKLRGDELVPHAKAVATRAVTIDAPPEAVWPWVVQVGMGRAGWYTYDWFYQATKSADFVDGHSSDRIVPQLQDVKLRDKIMINSAVGYFVDVIEKPRAFILHAGEAADAGKAFEPGKEPAEYMNTTLGWVLEPLPGGKTRLLARILEDGRGTGYNITSSPPLRFGGFLMARANLLGIKERAEKARQASGEGPGTK
jgi:hypothetical protein